MEKAVQCYRLWPDFKWDLVDITIDIIPELFENMEYIESKSVQKAWMQISDQKYKPHQIGLYMPSVMK